MNGEPFEPRHIVAGVKDVLGGTKIVTVLSAEPGWRTEHPTGTSGPWPGLRTETESEVLAGSASGVSEA